MQKDNTDENEKWRTKESKSFIVLVILLLVIH